MARETPPPKPPDAAPDPAVVADLLGGRRCLGADALNDPLALHDRLVRGLPASALAHFARRFPLVIKDTAFARVLGLPAAPDAGPQSARTRRLSCQESGQLWRLAVVLARTAPLLGGMAAAERWLLHPALGLGRRRPLDLLETPAGDALVADYLIQLDHGVYV